MKIGTKIFWSAFIPGVIFITIGIIIFYNLSAIKLTKEIENRLDMTIEERAKQLKLFLDDNSSTVKLISKENLFKNFLSTQKTDPKYYDLLNKVKERLIDIADTHDAIINSYLINSDGISVAYFGEDCDSKTQTCSGADKSDNTIFTEGRKGFYIQDMRRSEPNSNEVALNMSAPVLENNIFLGVISVRIKTEKLYGITSKIINYEDSGDVYLVNSDNYAITPLRSDETVILNKKIDTVNTRKCFSAAISQKNKKSYAETQYARHNPADVFKGFDGQETIGRHIYMPEMNWCLLVEVDKKEAFSSIRNLWMAACALDFAIFTFIFAFSFYIGRKIAEPIKNLQKDTEIISKGNLEHKLLNKSKDEIGQLSKSFNEMTDTIKKSREEINKKVNEQTLKIKEHEKSLEKSKDAAEKIVKAMVGREEKIIELRKEIEKLKNKK